MFVLSSIFLVLTMAVSVQSETLMLRRQQPLALFSEAASVPEMSAEDANRALKEMMEGFQYGGFHSMSYSMSFSYSLSFNYQDGGFPPMGDDDDDEEPSTGTTTNNNGGASGVLGKGEGLAPSEDEVDKSASTPDDQNQQDGVSDAAPFTSHKDTSSEEKNLAPLWICLAVGAAGVSMVVIYRKLGAMNRAQAALLNEMEPSISSNSDVTSTV